LNIVGLTSHITQRNKSVADLERSQRKENVAKRILSIVALEKSLGKAKRVVFVVVKSIFLLTGSVVTINWWILALVAVTLPWISDVSYIFKYYFFLVLLLC